jgi:hypothetical protein
LTPDIWQISYPFSSNDVQGKDLYSAFGLVAAVGRISATTNYPYVTMTEFNNRLQVITKRDILYNSSGSSSSYDTIYAYNSNGYLASMLQPAGTLWLYDYSFYYALPCRTAHFVTTRFDECTYTYNIFQEVSSSKEKLCTALDNATANDVVDSHFPNAEYDYAYDGWGFGLSCGLAARNSGRQHRQAPLVE